jgi:hypothetical protein
MRAERADTARELEAAEQRLEHAREHVIIPLAELRQENHVAPRLNRLIQRKAREIGGSAGT